jgi:DNA-binding transcriptional LysR family regulator
MDSDALLTFLAVHHAGGVSSAAERLGRSQPAISRRLAQLEGRVKAPLFDRIGGGLALSEAGRALLPFAERTVAALKDAQQAMTAFRRADAGVVQVAVVGTLADAKLTAALSRFRRAAPGAQVSLRTANSAEVGALVRRGEASVGLRYRAEPSPDVESRALTPEAMIVICAPGHRLAGRRVRSLAALRDERWLGFPGPSGRADDPDAVVAAHFATLGVDDFAFAPVDSLTAQKRLVEAGYGLALVPESAAREERSQRTLATIAVGGFRPTNPIFLIVRRDGYLSPASQRFIALLQAAY